MYPICVQEDIPSHLVDLQERSAKDLNKSQKQQLLHLFMQFQDIFSKTDMDIPGLPNGMQQTVHTGEFCPVSILETLTGSAPRILLHYQTLTNKWMLWAVIFS